MHPEIVPFEAEHLIDLMDVTDTIAQQAVAAERNAKHGGMAWSAMLDGKCIGCAIVLNEVSKFTIWVNTSPELLKHKLWFHRTSKRLYAEVKARAGGLPIQILCDTSNARALKWAWSFGFKTTAHTVLEAR